jgi:hypothetical protein
VKGHHQDLVMRGGGRIITKNPGARPVAALTGTRIRRLPIAKTIMVY